MMRRHVPRDIQRRVEASAPSRGLSARGSWVELAPMHSGGHDHIVGGGGVAAAFVASPDPVMPTRSNAPVTASKPVA